jgi:hypothetical protein
MDAPTETTVILFFCLLAVDVLFWLAAAITVGVLAHRKDYGFGFYFGGVTAFSFFFHAIGFAAIGGPCLGMVGTLIGLIVMLVWLYHR